MAYIVNKTNGSTLTVINDFSLDNTSSPLTLIGKGYKDWGETLNENLVKLLENFANDTPPTNPLNGQLWYDTTQNSLKIYNSTLSSWQSLQINIEGLLFYSQIFTSPTSGQVTGFINDNNIIALFSNINVSADKLDDGSLFPSVNAQTEFPRGIAPGLNLGNINSRIYGQDILTIGTIRVSGVNNIIEINLSGDTIVNNDFETKGTSKLHSVFVSGSDIINPKYYLPVSSGSLGQILVSRGNNNILVWENPETFITNDKIEGHSGPNYVQVKASASSRGVEIFTENKFRLIVDTDGNIGIDVSSPSYKIELRPNVSSNNVSIGLVNNNPLLKTSIDLVPEFNSGNSANVNFIRRGNLSSPITPTETLGSISWLGRNNSGEDQDVARIRSVVVTAHTSTIQGNLEFMIANVSGELYKTLEINEGGELTIYYDGGSNYYKLPSSAGNIGQYLVSNSANAALSWRDIENYEVLLTSFSLVGADSISIYNIPPNSRRIIYLNDFSPLISKEMIMLFLCTNGVSIHGEGVVVQYTKVSSLHIRVSSMSFGRITRAENLSSALTYDAKIIIDLNASSRAIVHGELYDHLFENRYFFNIINAYSPFSTECTAVQLFVATSAGYKKGTAKIVEVYNKTPVFTI